MSGQDQKIHRPRATRQDLRRPTPLSWWAVAAAPIIIAAVWAATTWLLGEAANATDPAAARVEAVKTGIGIGAGIGGMFALGLAARRQWHQELTAADTNHDAEARRVTELYAKAVEQLGSDKAPVRFGGLYALERLAQDNPAQRQTIINVWCAYLRMPYTPPGQPPAGTSDDQRAGDPKTDGTAYALYQQRVQEGEVRLTAQRLITDHLRSDPGTTTSRSTFWHDIDLDLTGATLIEFTFNRCTARTATFINATFSRHAHFEGATITDTANFHKATFTDAAYFQDTTFAGTAYFEKATFPDTATFTNTTFSELANFDSAIFDGVVPPEVQRYLP